MTKKISLKMSQCTGRVAQCLVHTRSDPNATKIYTKINTEEDIYNRLVHDTTVPLTPKVLKKKCSFKTGQKLNDAQLYR